MWSRSFRLAARGLVLVLLARAPSSAPRAQEPAPFAALRAGLERRLGEQKVPSLALAVAQDGKVLWEEAVGWANVEARVPATPDTPYLLASVSKPITATALLVMVERGKMDLDRPVDEYLGEAKLRARVGDAGQATLRRLADHTSGLARHDLFSYASDPGEPLSCDERIRRYGFLLRAPGETHEYSNLGYMVLAQAIERQAGGSFARFLGDEVFAPLGMKHSWLGVRPEGCEAAAVGYGEDGEPVRERTELHGGAGGIFASARDLLRFGLYHLGQRTEDQKTILSPQSLERMHRPSARTGPLSWYGLGWRTEEGAFGAPALLHTGQSGGATACLVLVPEARLCVVALANAASDLPWVVTEEIVASRVPRAAAAPQPAPGHELFGRSEYAPGAQWLGHWEGSVSTYERDIPVELWFDDSGAIRVQLEDQPVAVAGGVRIEDGYLRGSIDGDLGTSDTKGCRYRLHFKLRLRGDGVLNGSLTAGSAAGERVFTLSHWMEVRRGS
jgi:CubicO group peptidase (beta-lactamase class C family)